MLFRSECSHSLAKDLDRFFALPRRQVALTQLVQPFDARAVDGPERLVVRGRLLVLAPREEKIAEAEVGLAVAESRIQLQGAHDVPLSLLLIAKRKVRPSKVEVRIGEIVTPRNRSLEVAEGLNKSTLSDKELSEIAPGLGVLRVDGQLCLQPADAGTITPDLTKAIEPPGVQEVAPAEDQQDNGASQDRVRSEERRVGKECRL